MKRNFLRTVSPFAPSVLSMFKLDLKSEVSESQLLSRLYENRPVCNPGLLDLI